MAKILVVDDEPSIVKLVATTLRGRGHTVFEASDGYQAIEDAKTIRPDLILLDIMMPGIDGRETRKRLLADPTTKNIPVIHLSAVGDFQSQLEAVEDETGFTDYFTKPFSPRELADRVEEVLDPATRDRAARQAHQKAGKLRTIVEIMHRDHDE
jgi:DNA-binding response OmpR family regulator